MEFPSKIIEEAVNQFKTLPGVGKKTAVRLVLSLAKQQKQDISSFAQAIDSLAKEMKQCKVCKNFSDDDICRICANPLRDNGLICVVQDMRDVIAIENTGQYKGLYHVIGGVISPMDGIGPDELEIDSLVKRLQQGNIREIIFALSATMEGDTTMFYISKQMRGLDTKISSISRGIAIGGELEYVDEVTLGRSLQSRVPYQS